MPRGAPLTSQERQAAYRDRQSRREAEMKILIAALYKLLPEADRQRIDGIKRFQPTLREARALSAYIDKLIGGKNT